MTYLYKNYVVKEGIKINNDSKNNLRYLMEVPLRNDFNKSILVILKNPSKATKYISDHTINNVLNFCNSRRYSKVYIMNLYSTYSTDPKGIAKLIKDNQEEIAIGKNNDKILEQTSKKVEDIIVAWGSNTFGCTMKYKHRIEEVTKIIQGKNLYYVESKSKCGWYPKHAQIWSVNSNITMDKWSPPF